MATGTARFPAASIFRVSPGRVRRPVGNGRAVPGPLARRRPGPGTAPALARLKTANTERPAVLDALAAEFTAPFRVLPAEVIMVRLLAAMLLGAAIGVEREMNARTAGLRTHILIALSACLFALVSFEILGMEAASGQNWNSDPLRLIEAVTAGVAFLAAGSIITSRGRVQGLTTGAGMWAAGAIGLSCGVGRIPLAILATLMAIIVLWLFRRLSRVLGGEARD